MVDDSVSAAEFITDPRPDYRFSSTGFFYRRNKEGCPEYVGLGAPNVVVGPILAYLIQCVSAPNVS
jgi:hypothetical protein